MNLVKKAMQNKIFVDSLMESFSVGAWGFAKRIWMFSLKK